MAKKRINGEGTVWYVASEKRYRAQYPAGGKRRTISGKTRREVELKLRDALVKRDTNTLEKSRKDSDTVEDFLLFWVSAKTPGWQFNTIKRVYLDINKFIIPEIGSVKLSDLTAEMIERVYVNIMKKHGISDRLLLHVNSTLRTALERAAKLKRIATNSMLSGEYPIILVGEHGELRNVGVVAQDEFNAVRQAIEETRWNVKGLITVDTLETIKDVLDHVSYVISYD